MGVKGPMPAAFIKIFYSFIKISRRSLGLALPKGTAVPTRHVTGTCNDTIQLALPGVPGVGVRGVWKLWSKTRVDVIAPQGRRPGGRGHDYLTL
eukprot:COSAG01_NODE_1295_length_10874_cov_10.154710_5_plen_94_part_00